MIFRNGLTGELVKKNSPSPLPVHYQPHRVRRTRLQSALKAKVPEGIIKLNKRLASLEDLECQLVTGILDFVLCFDP
jgi:salicylate hydroxylase